MCGPLYLSSRRAPMTSVATSPSASKPCSTIGTLLTRQSLACFAVVFFVVTTVPHLPDEPLTDATQHPPAAGRRSRRKEARPGELLEAALDLFVEKGFAATRVEEVAARAGVSKGTLFLYFPSKLELFKAVVRHNIAGRFDEWRLTMEHFEGSSSELLRAFHAVGSSHIALHHRPIHEPHELDSECAKERAEERLRQKQSIREYHLSKAALARAMARLKATR